MPESGAPYDRSRSHTKSRGSESTVECTFCGRKIPKYKAITRKRGMRIKDPAILKAMDDERNIHTVDRKQYICPSCARHRQIVKRDDKG